MAVFLITYDLIAETVRPNITGVVHAFRDYMQLSESSYAVSTSLSADAVYARFSRVLDSDDTLYVITLSKPISGQGSDETNKWLAEHL